MDFVVAEPLLAGFCEFVGEGLNQVHCLTSLDNHMVMINQECSFDGGPPQPCKAELGHSKLYFCFQSYAQCPACLAISNFLVGIFTSNNNVIILNIAYAQ